MTTSLIFLIVLLGSQLVFSSKLPEIPSSDYPVEDFWMNDDLWRDFSVIEIMLEFQKQHPDIFQQALDIFKIEISKVPETLKEFISPSESNHDLQPLAILDIFNISRTPCQICTLIAAGLKAVAINETFMTPLTEVLIAVCENVTYYIRVKGDPLCRGVLELQMPHVFEALRPTTLLPGTHCTFLNFCYRNTAELGPSGFDSYDEPVKKTERASKQRVNRTRDPVTGLLRPPENSISLAQITDVHIEPSYKAGTNTACGLPVCCLEQWGPGNAGALGDFNCNIPRSTIEIFLNKINEMDPDLIIFTGDAPPHTIWNQSEASQRNCSEQLVDAIKKSLPNRNVLPVIGNHEFHPINQFSWYNMLGDHSKGFVNFFADLWKDVANFSDAELVTVLQGGFYSKLVADKLRIVALNTNFMYTLNWYNALNHRGVLVGPGSRPSEYQRMTSFIESELREARVKEEKVILLSHHPPGNPEYLIVGSQWYRKLILEFNDVIVLQTSGHTHYDEFRMIFDDAKNPVATMYVLPSMSSKGTRNPSMRIYYLDEETKELLDYDHYFLDIRPAMYNPETWTWNSTNMIKLLYTASEEYELPDLSAKSWNDLLNRFKTDRMMLRKHISHSQADGDVGTGLSFCGDRCSAKHICRQSHVNFDEYRACVPSLSFPEFNITIPSRPTSGPIVPDTAAQVTPFLGMTLLTVLEMIFYAEI